MIAKCFLLVVQLRPSWAGHIQDPQGEESGWGSSKVREEDRKESRDWGLSWRRRLAVHEVGLVQK